ncbi:MAG: hypothetical protein JW829_15365 [Pirellulales bacterium]|nr:hypothetical protein [Pirellulales bacterium]
MSHDRILIRQANFLPAAVVGLLAMTAAFSGRRLAGAFASPLPAPMLLGIAALFVLLIWAVQRGNENGIGLFPGQSYLGNRRFSAEKKRNPISSMLAQGRNTLCLWGLFLASLLAMFAFSWPATRLIDWAVWLPILVGEVGLLGIPMWFRIVTRKEFRAGSQWEHLARTKTLKESGLSSGDVPAKNQMDLPIGEENSLSLPPCQDRVLQKITRIRDVAGHESLYGTFCAEFMPNDRTVILHAAFCPPLVIIPDVHVEQTSGPDATIRVTQVFAHGARIEVRLAQPAPAPVPVTFDIAVSGSQ